MSTRNVTYGPVRSSEALLRANALMAVRLKEQVANLEAIKARRAALTQKYKALDFRIEVILDAIKTIDNDLGVEVDEALGAVRKTTIGMDSGKRNAFWHEKKVLNEMISGSVVEINERTRFIKLLSKQKPELAIQSRINQEQLAIGKLSRQCQALVLRLAIVELMLAVSNN